MVTSMHTNDKSLSPVRAAKQARAPGPYQQATSDEWDPVGE
jgi:hypothetical protein